jgi:hypothetical protein
MRLDTGVIRVGALGGFGGGQGLAWAPLRLELGDDQQGLFGRADLPGAPGQGQRGLVLAGAPQAGISAFALGAWADARLQQQLDRVGPVPFDPRRDALQRTLRAHLDGTDAAVGGARQHRLAEPAPQRRRAEAAQAQGGLKAPARRRPASPATTRTAPPNASGPAAQRATGSRASSNHARAGAPSRGTDCSRARGPGRPR